MAETAGSASKTEDQKKAQTGAKNDVDAAAKAGQVELEHGEAPEKENKPQDPWGETPLQMRDVHSPEVDPAKVGTVRGGFDALPGGGDTKPSSLEPGAEGGTDKIEGGTNAPA